MSNVMDIVMSELKQPLWGKWYIKDVIGNGASSSVYRIEAKRSGRTDVSALKVEPIMANDTYFIGSEKRRKDLEKKRLEAVNETNIMYKLRNCQYIVRYEDEDTLEVIHEGKMIGYCLLIRMEYLQCLQTLMRKGELDCSERNIIKIAKDIGRGIQAAHKNGIIHRDIKPANFFVGEEGIYKLGDFNISKVSSSAKTFAGTEGYIAPEVYYAKKKTENSYTRQADIYSFGICLYQLMNDYFFPYEEEMDSDNALDKLLSGEEKLPPPKNASPEFAAIILKACAFDAANRYATIDDMLKDINYIEAIAAENNTMPVRGSNHRLVLPVRPDPDNSANVQKNAGVEDRLSAYYPQQSQKQKNASQTSPESLSCQASVIPVRRDLDNSKNVPQNTGVEDRLSAYYPQQSQKQKNASQTPPESLLYQASVIPVRHDPADLQNNRGIVVDVSECIKYHAVLVPIEECYNGCLANFLSPNGNVYSTDTSAFFRLFPVINDTESGFWEAFHDSDYKYSYGDSYSIKSNCYFTADEEWYYLLMDFVGDIFKVEPLEYFNDSGLFYVYLDSFTYIAEPKYQRDDIDKTVLLHPRYVDIFVEYASRRGYICEAQDSSVKLTYVHWPFSTAVTGYYPVDFYNIIKQTDLYHHYYTLTKMQDNKGRILDYAYYYIHARECSNINSKLLDNINSKILGDIGGLSKKTCTILYLPVLKEHAEIGGNGDLIVTGDGRDGFIVAYRRSAIK